MKLISFCFLLQACLCVHLTLAHKISIETNRVDKVQHEILHDTKVKMQPGNDNSDLNILIKNTDSLNTLPPGVKIYIKAQSPNKTEVIICEKRGKASQLNAVLTTLLRKPAEITKFLEKGFLFGDKASQENCTGMLYYNIEKLTEHISLNYSQVLALLPFSSWDFPTEAIKDFKIETGETTLDISLAYYGVPFKVLQENNIWDLHANKVNITSDGSKYQIGGNEIEVGPKKASLEDKRGIHGVATLQGKGLHQSITKKFTLTKSDDSRVSFNSDRECDIVLLDVLSEQTYVDQDEIRGIKYMDLKRFEVLDIEKPTETAKQYVWMVRMNLDELKKRSGRPDELEITYPVHFRYQSPKNEAFSDSHLLLKTKFFTNCAFGDILQEDIEDSSFYAEKIRKEYGEGYKKIRMVQSVSDDKAAKAKDWIVVSVPVGDIKLQEIVTAVTLLVSIGGAAAILFFILRGNNAKKIK